MMNAKEEISSGSQILTMGEFATLKKIKATYDEDDLDFNMSPILQLIEDAVYASVVSSDQDPGRPIFQYKDTGPMHHTLASKINVISSEILGSCNRYQDTNETVLSMFGALSTLSWVAKGIIALAAFAINYGEFRLVVEQRSNDKIANLVALLENVPEDLTKQDFYCQIANLARAATDLIKYLFKVKYIYHTIIKSQQPKMDLNAKLHIAIYWIVQSIVTCQSIITNFASTGYESMSLAAEQWDLSYLQKKLTVFHQEIESETHEKIWNLFPENDITILTHVICSEDLVPTPLIHGETKEPQKVDMQKNKVLLYISDLSSHEDEIEILKRMHNSLQENVQIVWLTVLDKPEDWDEKKFESKRSLMPWLVVRKPELLDRTVIKFINNVWEFKKRSIVVAFDENGIVKNKDALPMILIWGKSAFPFSRNKEAELWSSQPWGLKLLLRLPESITDSDDRKKINEWEQWFEDKDNYICLYGGEDKDWINRFEEKLRAIVNDLNIPSEKLKMLNINSLSMAWIIWLRIEAMFLSRSRQLNSDSRQLSGDSITEGALALCSFHWSCRGWAIISKGSDELMAKALGNTMLSCLNKCNVEEWKKNGLVESLNECISKHCETLHFHPTFPEIPPKKVCPHPDCGRLMRKSVTFHCSGDRKPQA